MAGSEMTGFLFTLQLCTERERREEIKKFITKHLQDGALRSFLCNNLQTEEDEIFYYGSNGIRAMAD